MDGLALLNGMSQDELATFAQSLLHENGIKWGDLERAVADHVGRPLTREDRKFLGKQISIHRCNLLSTERSAVLLQLSKEEVGPSQILVVTSYTHNYTIGSVCSNINQQYCERHGYRFLEDVMPLAEMKALIKPRKFCGWHKIHLLLSLLERVKTNQDDVQYMVWIDADAIVIDHTIKLEDIVSQGKGRDLMIAEDQAGLLNTGVMILRVCDWVKAILEEVWETKRYFLVRQYEQAALERVLRKRFEGIELVCPFHSFCENGPSGVKYFPHVSVFPGSMLNSNVHKSVAKDAEGKLKKNHKLTSASFLYHPYGCKQKLQRLSTVIKFAKLDDGLDPNTISQLSFDDGKTLTAQLCRT